MSTQDRLQIINATGNVIFYLLNPAQGVTSIGRDPENDIILDDPQIAPIQANLIYRQNSYYLLITSNEGQVKLRNQPLRANGAIPLHHLDEIELGQHLLVLVRQQLPISPIIPTPTSRIYNQPFLNLPAKPANMPRPTSRPMELDTSFTPAPSRPAPPYSTPEASLGRMQQEAWEPGDRLDAPPRDQIDDIIMARLSETSWSVSLDRDETAIYELTISNRGDLVANFAIATEGLDPEWIERLDPVSANLYKGDSARFIIRVKPPYSPTSLAGSYPFAIIVTSENYPDRFSQLGAVLIINPFFQFSLSEPSPKLQTISWSKRYGTTQIQVHNKSNILASFQLEGISDEKRCSFEFIVPGKQVALTRQVPLQLPPESYLDSFNPEPVPYVATIPIHILPHERPLLLRKQVHHFEMMVTLLDDPNSPLAVRGELRQKPFLGPILFLLIVVLMLLLCASSIWSIFGPQVETFTVNGGINPQKINAGEEALLEWQASPFTDLKLDPEVGWLPNPAGQLHVTPKETTLYTLEATSFLSALLPFQNPKIERQIIVEPVEPEILIFTADPTTIILGEESILTWEVIEAEELLLTGGNGLPETVPTAQHLAQHPVAPSQNTTYGLKASNIYGETSKNVEVIVVTPTGTPVPTPVVEFNVSSPQIVQGESVNLSWVVSGADSVSINPLGPVPPNGNISHSPLEPTLYTLSAIKQGAAPVNIPRNVNVIIATGTPSPTPTPAAPEIIDFKASKTTLVIGSESDKTVTLLWVIEGEVTDVQLANKDNLIIQTQLDPNGQIEVPVTEDSDLFTLIAFNEDKSSRKSVTLGLETPTPPPTATPPAPIITNFEAFAADSNARIEPIFEESDTKKNVYEVVANSNIRFKWTVQRDPTDVSLVGGGDTFPGRGTTESNFSAPFLNPVTDDGEYKLIAKNDSGIDEYTISLEVIDQDPPPAPLDFEYKATTGTFVWDYDPDHFDDILGFRIYRTNNGSPKRMADESELLVNREDGQVNEVVREWDPEDELESDPAGCDDIYFIVAVYKDISDLKKRETDSAEDSVTIEDRTALPACNNSGGQ